MRSYDALSDKIRAFVATELPGALRDGLEDLISDLDREHTGGAGGAGRSGVKWAVAQNIHLTLKFLGEIDPEQAQDISAALEQIGRETAPFTARATGVGGFPNTRRPRVLWVGIDENEALAGLHRAIDSALEPLGFECEKRPFKPHLTLCRGRTPEASRALAKTVAAVAPEFKADFAVDSFVFFKSVLRPHGAEHSIVSRITLRGEKE